MKTKINKYIMHKLDSGRYVVYNEAVKFSKFVDSEKEAKELKEKLKR